MMSEKVKKNKKLDFGRFFSFFGYAKQTKNSIWETRNILGELKQIEPYLFVGFNVINSLIINYVFLFPK